MRAAILLFVLLALAAAAIWLFGQGDEVGPVPSPSPANGVHVARPDAPVSPLPPSPSPTAGIAVTPDAAPAAVATRVQGEIVTDPDLADVPTACLCVVELLSQKPVAGASVRRLQSGALLGFTDDHGLVELPLKQRDQLAVVADGHLLRLATADIGTTRSAPQSVRLVRDRWSARVRFEFSAGGRPITTTVFARLRPLDDAAKAGKGGPGPADPVTSRAWTEHTMLGAHAACADALVQLGAYSADRVLRLSPTSVVAFASGGRFRIEAATADGFVAQHELTIAPAVAGDHATVSVRLDRGNEVRGAVRGAVGPLGDARVSVQGGDPLGLLATTGAGGVFRLGPLAPGPVTLLVRHGDHEPIAFGPIDSGSQETVIAMKPLPVTTLRGRVRSRPDLQPLASATVAWQVQGEKPIATRTDTDGTFRLPATGNLAARLFVTAPGYIALEELVAPGSPFADYDLLPNSPEIRVEKGMSAMFTGIVVDAQGQPAVGTHVRWTPDQPAAPPGMPARRTLSGGTLDLPGVATTGADGTFWLETNAFGPGLLGIARAPAEQGLRLEAIAGVAKAALRLQR